jgi:exopolyphosphatase / guanosine-5'-triphosphate,3'-diphosphate pyrophosphatase
VRIAVVDLGTNSTRLLVADLADGRLDEVERHTAVTSLGRGVGLTGTICADAIEEVCAAVAEFKQRYEELGADRVVVIATSAVRDARNGGAFIAELRERFGLGARLLSGEEEAQLTYLGATAGRPPEQETLVFDIGGGSTELVVGRGEQVEFHVSLQAGTIRHSERHLAADPPGPAALEQLADDVRHAIERSLDGGARARRGIAVAGTPTSLAAVDQELEPYSSERVHGYRLGLGPAQRMLSRLAALPLAERLRVKGLHPRRAPTIVAGTVILVQVMRAFGLEEVEVSEKDILHGAGLSLVPAPA